MCDPGEQDDAPQSGVEEQCPPQLPCFQLQGCSAGFSSRTRTIFQGLEGTVQRADPPAPPVLTEERAPPAGCLPDYIRHPGRWTRYSLHDVPESSDGENGRVALQYIHGLRARKRRSEDEQDESVAPLLFNQDSSSSSQGRVMFTRRSRGGEPRSGCRSKGHSQAQVELHHLEDHKSEYGEESSALSSLIRQKNKHIPTNESGLRKQPLQPSEQFHSSRKMKRQNLRRTSEQQEED